jgi:hypothetical protein
MILSHAELFLSTITIVEERSKLGCRAGAVVK